MDFDRRASTTFSESSFLTKETKFEDDPDDELFIPELGTGQDHTLPGLGSLQCLATEPYDEDSTAKPLKSFNLGSVPEGLGRLGTSGTDLESGMPSRLGEFFFFFLIKYLENGRNIQIIKLINTTQN